MTIWSGLGINYGHQATYDTTQVETDLTFLKSQGVTRLRIALPAYGDATGITNCEDMVTRALNHGFYVSWGVTNSGTTTATTWAAFKTYVTGTLLPWAKTNGLSELSVGNEEEAKVDGTSITATTVRADLRSQAAAVKSGGFVGKVSYQTQTNQIANWNSDGLGSLDIIGFNCYDTLANFTSTIASIHTDFGANAYVSEFGCITSGYGDYNNENSYATDVLARISALQSANIAYGYFFCYRDGGFGLTANTFGLVQTSGIAHCVRGAVLNTPGQKIFSGFNV